MVRKDGSIFSWRHATYERGVKQERHRHQSLISPSASLLDNPSIKSNKDNKEEALDDKTHLIIHTVLFSKSLMKQKTLVETWKARLASIPPYSNHPKEPIDLSSMDSIGVQSPLVLTQKKTSALYRHCSPIGQL
jgi:hypothetical protein